MWQARTRRPETRSDRTLSYGCRRWPGPLTLFCQRHSTGPAAAIFSVVEREIRPYNSSARRQLFRYKSALLLASLHFVRTCHCLSHVLPGCALRSLRCPFRPFWHLQPAVGLMPLQPQVLAITRRQHPVAQTPPQRQPLLEAVVVCSACPAQHWTPSHPYRESPPAERFLMILRAISQRTSATSSRRYSTIL